MILLFSSLALAVLQVEAPPQAGTEVAITLLDDLSRPVAGATVRAIYREGISEERDLAVGLTDARGRVYWTPKQGGPVVLRAKRDELRVNVAYGWPPLTPIAVGIPVGTLGMGLLAFGLWGSRRRKR
ncbi:MAG: hypothetical protein AB8H79_24280 [Myxococcota bacterium]